MAKKVDMNKYRRRTDKDNGEPDLTIIPSAKNGIQLPAMEWMLINPPKPRFKVNMGNITKAEWFPKISIDTQIPVADYIAVINWWFDKAREDESYGTLMVETFSSFRPGVLKEQVLLAKGWLIKHAGFKNARTGKFNARKKDIDSFLTGWLTRDLNNPKLVKTNRGKW